MLSFLTKNVPEGSSAFNGQNEDPAVGLVLAGDSKFGNGQDHAHGLGIRIGSVI
jgi:hypothetical protein